MAVEASPKGAQAGRAPIPWLRLILIASAAPALYLNTIDSPFQFDGIKEIKNNRAIADLFDVGAIWNYNPSRFLVFLSFALNRHLGGESVFGYHLVNILIHSINSLLVYGLVRRLFCASRRIGQADDPSGWAAFLAALLFAVHPLQTESVTYIWQRSASMGAMFYLLSLAAYLQASLSRGEPSSAEKWRGWLFLSFLSAAAGMFTKQFCFTLPPALILLEYCAVSGSISELKKRAHLWLPFIPLTAIVPFLTFYYGRGEILDVTARASETPSPFHYLLTQFNVIALYLKLFIYPAGQNLDHDVPIAASALDSAPALLLLLAILAGGFLAWGKSRMAAFGIFFFFLALSVESSFFPLPDIAFEHRMYLPLAGVFIALAALASLLLRRWRRLAAPMAALALIAAAAFSAVTVHRNRVWASEESLWEDVAAKSPGKWRGYLKLGSVKKRLGKFGEAEKLYEKAVELAPEIAEAHHDLAALKKIGGDLKGAESHFKKALELKPEQFISAFELGKIYMVQGKYESAQAEFAHSTAVAPRFLPAWRLLGQIHELKGDWAEAQKAYRQILAQYPDDPEAKEALTRAIKAGGESSPTPRSGPY